jgi:hypothetical protein
MIDTMSDQEASPIIAAQSIHMNLKQHSTNHSRGVQNMRRVNDNEAWRDVGGSTRTSGVRNLTVTGTDGIPAAFFVLVIVFSFVGVCYILNTFCGNGNPSLSSEDDEIGIKSKKKRELGTGLITIDEEEDKFDAHIRRISTTVRKSVNKSVPYERRHLVSPGSGIYKGAQSLVLELKFEKASGLGLALGFVVIGAGEDSVHDICITDGFLSTTGEMYWVEERQSRQEVDAGTDSLPPPQQLPVSSRTCVRGRFNFDTREFRGWFETDRELCGRCVLLASDEPSSRLVGFNKRNSERFVLSAVGKKQQVDYSRRRSSAFTVVTSNTKATESLASALGVASNNSQTQTQKPLMLEKLTVPEIV